MTFNEYLKRVQHTFLNNPTLRLGQAYFIEFARISPITAQAITATASDPFYMNRNLEEFCEIVHNILGDFPSNAIPLVQP